MKETGLTLVEVLIAIGISVMVGALLLIIIVNSMGLFYKESAKVQEGLNVNDALGKVRSSIKESSGVVASKTLESTTYTSSVTQIVLKIPALNSLGNTIPDTFDYIVFLKDQTNLRYKLFPDSQSSRKSQDQIFSTSLDSLTFNYLDSQNPPVEVTAATATKVRISLTLKQQIGVNYQTTTATAEANLRND